MVPDVDIFETGEGLVLLADMPGVSEGGAEVSVDNDNLTIVGRVQAPEATGVAEMHAEFRLMNYRRVFTVSRDIDTAQVHGSISQGVLRLTLPKSDRAKVKRIPIEAP